MSILETSHKMTLQEQECYDLGYKDGMAAAASTGLEPDEDEDVPWDEDEDDLKGWDEFRKEVEENFDDPEYRIEGDDQGFYLVRRDHRQEWEDNKAACDKLLTELQEIISKKDAFITYWQNQTDETIDCFYKATDAIDTAVEDIRKCLLGKATACDLCAYREGAEYELPPDGENPCNGCKGKLPEQMPSHWLWHVFGEPDDEVNEVGG